MATQTVVDMRSEVVHRYVFELRYEFGQLYWDHAGRIARDIASEPGWGTESIDNNKCRLSLPDKNLVFNFGPGSADLSQTQSADVSALMAVEEFAKTAESLVDKVVRSLEPSHYPRIGFRSWYLYGTATGQESQNMSLRLALTARGALQAAELGDVTEVTHRIIFDRPGYMLRVALAPFEQNVNLPDSVVRAAREKAKERWKDQRHVRIAKLKAQKIIDTYPQFGLLVDLDAYIEDPPYPDNLQVSEFVLSAASDFKQVKSVVLRESTAAGGE